MTPAEALQLAVQQGLSTPRQLLQAAMDNGLISAQDQKFAHDLLRKAARYQPSPRQEYWMGELVARANRPAPMAEKLAGNVAGIFEIFQTAQASGLRYPKIRLQTTADQDESVTVQFALAGERSKTPGHVQITDGQAFGSNRYFGRITPDGELVAGRDMIPAVRELVAGFAEDPAQVAKAYGKRTGHCCFCRRYLETKESLAAGYGPVCAEKFGLPWGEVPGDDTEQSIEQELVHA